MECLKGHFNSDIATPHVFLYKILNKEGNTNYYH
jgi:hypothetical protein